MSLQKNACPLLEYDDSPSATLNPDDEQDLPHLCLVTSFSEMVEGWISEYGGEEIGHFFSEMREFPIYRIEHRGVKIALTQLCEGSAMAAIQADSLFARGVECLILADSCGLLRNVDSSRLILPLEALRDESVSYKYLPAERFIQLEDGLIQSIRQSLQDNEVEYDETKTWTSDAFYRMTQDLVAYRREEGCFVTDKSIASIAAVAAFRKKKMAALLCAGYRIEYGKHEDMDLSRNPEPRLKTFCLALDALSRC